MTEIGLFDSHLHLQDYEPGTNIGLIIQQAANAGVTNLVCNGTEENDWSEVLHMNQSYSQVIPCLGLHPWFAASATAGWEDKLETYIANSSAGVGEIGLDRLRKPFHADIQEHAFIVQLDMAYRYKRPAMIHCVRSWGWMLDILRSRPALPDGILIHSYAGSTDMIQPLYHMGAYFSFSGNILADGHQHAKAAIKAVPKDRLLIETDSPNMIPPSSYCKYKVTFSDGYEGNHPGNLPSILAGAADLINIPENDLRCILWDNSMRFFKSIMQGDD